MLFARETIIQSGPVFSSKVPPFVAILKRWIKSKFDPDACRADLEAVIEGQQLDPELFRLAAIEEGGLVLAERALFPEVRGRSLTLISPGGRGLRERPIGNDLLPLMREFIALGTQTTDLVGFREAGVALGLDPELLDECIAPPDAGHPRWAEAGLPGVYRREHASLLIRSRTTSILLDPLCMNAQYPHIPQSPFNLGTDAIDAICITHGHADHWHLPSIFRYVSGAGTHVVVPRVPRVNLLTFEDFHGALELHGLRPSSPEWGSVIEVGDVKIELLPFYGEQPVRDPPGPPPGLRSWGNCYRFITPDFSAFVLVDSGADPSGDMSDVIRESVGRHGPADIVLSSIREFPSPFFGGTATDWATLPFSRLRELFAEYEANRLQPTTLGVAGVSRVCAEARASYYLPYANGFMGAGREIKDVGWGMGEPSEAEQLRALEEVFREQRVKTTPLDWNPGDSMVLRDGRLTLVRYAS